MSRRYYDRDVEKAALEGKTVAVVGYGNQGRAQSCNLRDSGVHVVVGNIRDEYRDRAEAEGMHPVDIPDAVAGADVVCLLIPDEVQPEVLAEQVLPALRPDATLDFASGYNVHFGFVTCPDTVDVVMVAPRMIGDAVRSRYVDGSGFPTMVAVHQDASGQAWDTTLALAHGIGGTRMGAWEGSFEMETVLDLFCEQLLGPSEIASYMIAFDVLVEAGYDPDMVQLEFYGSGENVEVEKAVYRRGLLNKLLLESPMSQYGHLSRVARLMKDSAAEREHCQEVLDELVNGTFAREWRDVRDHRARVIEELRSQVAEHPIFAVEARVRDALGLTTD